MTLESRIYYKNILNYINNIDSWVNIPTEITNIETINNIICISIVCYELSYLYIKEDGKFLWGEKMESYYPKLSKPNSADSGFKKLYDVIRDEKD